MRGAQGAGVPQSSAQSEDLRIPARVEVAFDILRWANTIETGKDRNFPTDATADGRDLRAAEGAVYDSALEILRLYLSGEMNFDDSVDSKPDKREEPQESFCSNTEKT